MRIVRSLNRRLWSEFLTRHPQSQIFHTPEMFQVFKQSKGYMPTLWAVVDDNAQPLVLLLPVEITLKGGIARRFTSRAVAYASVLCVPGVDGHALELLLQTYKREVGKRVLFTELRNPLDISDLQPILNANGFIYEDHLNFFIDLTRPSSEIWGNLKSNARRNVRKARKSKVAIEEITKVDQIPGIYEMLQQTYERLQVPLADLSFFHAAFNVLYPNDMMKVLVARHEGIEVGVLTLLLYKGRITYWYTGAPRKYSKYRVSDLLVWYTLEWGHSAGFHLFDFGGAGTPEETYGVRDFKAKYGGELVNHGRNVYVHNPLMFNVSKNIYYLVRRLLYGG